jgi:hypothetical protein
MADRLAHSDAAKAAIEKPGPSLQLTRALARQPG